MFTETKTDTRRNRRATTDRPVRGNRPYDIRVLRDGYGIKRTSHHYMRNTSHGVYTGPIKY